MDFKKTILLLVLFVVFTNAMFSNFGRGGNRRRYQGRDVQADIQNGYFVCISFFDL